MRKDKIILGGVVGFLILIALGLIGSTVDTQSSSDTTTPKENVTSEQINKTAIMDDYTKDGLQALDECYAYIDDANMYIEDYDLDGAASSLAAADESLNRATQYFEEASKYADGPYKEYLGMMIETLDILGTALDSLNSALDALYAGDYEGCMYYVEEANMYLEIVDQKTQEMEAFLDEHPDVYQHISENWI